MYVADVALTLALGSGNVTRVYKQKRTAGAEKDTPTYGAVSGRGLILTFQDGGSHCAQLGQFTVRPFAIDFVISWLQRFGQVSGYRLSEFVQLGMVKDQVPQSIWKVSANWLFLLEK